MRDNRHFDLRRFGLLIRNDILIHYRRMLIAAGAVSGILLIASLIYTASGPNWEIGLDSANRGFHSVFYLLTLFLGGAVVTSISFGALHQEPDSYTFLTLPISALERFLGKLLLTSLGYVVASLFVYCVFSLIAAGTSALFFRESFPIFNPFGKIVLLCIGVYLVGQSVFLLGAIYFRKDALIKTLLALSCFAIVLSSFAIVVIWLSYRDVVPIPSREMGVFMESLWEEFWHIIRVLFWVAIAPFFWVVAYLRLREGEV